LATGRVERRLAAILAADVAGYSRLMGEDEEGTLARLKALWRELADPKIKEHRGRIVKTTGDGLLLEFASVVDAVRCAVEVRQASAREPTQHVGELDHGRRPRSQPGHQLIENVFELRGRASHWCSLSRNLIGPRPRKMPLLLSERLFVTL
jgi:class 3 adenylate cyclase